MSEYIRVALSKSHTVDIEIPQSLINSDPTRAAVLAYERSVSRSALAAIPHGGIFPYVHPAVIADGPSPSED